MIAAAIARKSSHDRWAPGRDAEVLPDVADESLFGELVGAQVDVLSRGRVR